MLVMHGCIASIEQRKQRGMSSKYVLHEVCRGQYRFTLTSHRGQVLLTSGLYMDQDTALRKINATRHWARKSENYDLLTAEDGGRYFTVVTRKGEALAYSAAYPDAESRQAAINLVKSNNRGARLTILTQDLACTQERPVASGRFAARPPRSVQSSERQTPACLPLQGEVLAAMNLQASRIVTKAKSRRHVGGLRTAA
jgi:uncharacterized protein YegP (UPF0339 family)